MSDLTFALNGLCIAYDFRALILTGAGAEQVATPSGPPALRAGHGQRPKWETVARGDVTLTLGVALFDRPFVFVPRSIITERNQTIEGEVVFDWLTNGVYHMPRSEVFGVDARGREAQIFARDIDIEASPIALLDYGTRVIGIVEIDPSATDQPQRLDRSDLPDRFRRALKCYRAGSGAAFDTYFRSWIDQP